jgi:hypothetical protein
MRQVKKADMKDKETVINEIETAFDPRSARWENRAIIDTLKETESITAKALCQQSTRNMIVNCLILIV